MKREAGREVAALLLAGLAVFVLLSLITYTPADDPASYWPRSEPVRNGGGLIGANLASGLRHALGCVPSYLAALLTLGWVLHIFARFPLLELWYKVTGGILFLAAAATLEGLLARPGTFAGHPAGGVIGTTFARILPLNLGLVGTYLAVLIFAGVSLLLATDLLFYEVAKAALRRSRTLWILLRTRRVRPVPAPRDRGPRIVALPVATPTTTVPRETEPYPDETEPGPATEASAPAQRTEGTAPARKPAHPARTRTVGSTRGTFELPSPDLLDPPRPALEVDGADVVTERARIIEHTLREFGIDAHVVSHAQGPTVTLYEVEIASGIKVTRILSLSDNLAMSLRALTVRIQAPIPGKAAVGIEVPNEIREVVSLRDLLDLSGPAPDLHLPLYLGKDIAGAPIVADLHEMPHLLIAGQTGSGKSIGINGILLSLIMTRSPEDVRLILIDPKMVELSLYENVPHLLCPVVTDMEMAPAALDWACAKMDDRLERFARVGVRDIVGYNALGAKRLRKRLDERGVPKEDWEADYPVRQPYIVIVVDELADLKMVRGKEVEEPICRLTQKARAAGIHVILATQRPSVDVVTGLIKANMPSRIAYKVPTRIESKIILDTQGAESLVGKGDMLYITTGLPAPRRAQGAYVSEAEVERVVDFLRSSAEPSYSQELLTWRNRSTDSGGGGSCDAIRESDDLFDRAVDMILAEGRGSVSLLQRRMGIGFNRAARLIEMMGEAGVLGPARDGKAREILLSFEEWERQKAGRG